MGWGGGGLGGHIFEIRGRTFGRFGVLGSALSVPSACVLHCVLFCFPVHCLLHRCIFCCCFCPPQCLPKPKDSFWVPLAQKNAKSAPPTSCRGVNIISIRGSAVDHLWRRSRTHSNRPFWRTCTTPSTKTFLILVTSGRDTLCTPSSTVFLLSQKGAIVLLGFSTTRLATACSVQNRTPSSTLFWWTGSRMCAISVGSHQGSPHKGKICQI